LGPNKANIPKILVGNKCDLKSEIQVTTQQAQTFADMNQLPLFETSAKDDSKQDHIEAIFMTLAYKLKSCKPFFIPNEINKAKVESIDITKGREDDARSECSC
jgi:Ras-related protein Rab-33B